jgi:DNA-binding transcriptional LysR family regulator
MDLEAVDYFIKVAEAQSLSHAAKLYGLPKSSLSHKVRALEDSLGVALFVRDGRELHLSDAGAEFLDHAQRIKESCEGAKAAIAEARHDIAGTLTIGSTGEFGTSFTSELLFAFRQPSGVQSWHMQHGGDVVDFTPTAQCMANDYWMLKYFAVAGEGIVYLPAFFTEIECMNGDLVPVLPDWRSPLVSINLLYMRRRYVSRKFAAFLDFCLDYYRQRAAYSSPRYCVEVVRPLAGARSGGESNK